MYIGPQLIEFTRACERAGDEQSLEALLTEMTRMLGFEQFALNHHVDLVGPPGNAVVLMNYDPQWIAHALIRGYHLDDPVHAASARAVEGFWWRDLTSFIQLTSRQRRILEEARGFGLCEGFTVPIHVPGEYRGTCSFGARSARPNRATRLKAELIGHAAFNAARRLIDRRRGTAPAPLPKLTQRQLDCIAFIAAGKSDGVIAQILGLSPTTVHSHVMQAMRRYAVGSRIQLVVRALFDGQIVYNAAFGW